MGRNDIEAYLQDDIRLSNVLTIHFEQISNLCQYIDGTYSKYKEETSLTVNISA